MAYIEWVDLAVEVGEVDDDDEGEGEGEGEE